jgi:hypothetical protein
MTMREARALYFEVNGFGATGGYEDAWVDFKLGPIPMPFPNTPGRVRAVRYHDLHHLLTGYDTDTTGEFEIGAWEIAAGCKGFAAAWVLNLGALAFGAFSAPKRTFAAFVRGRAEKTTYGEDLEPLLDLTVAEARERFAAAAVRGATWLDVVLFILAVAVGLAVAVMLFALVVPLVPVGLLTHAARRRRLSRAAT